MHHKIDDCKGASNAMAESILLFAGTTEGRRLFHALSKANISVTASVATEYGKECLSAAPGQVLAGRMEEKEMETLLETGTYTLVVDATHPYALQVTENIRQACRHAGIPYLRLLREQGQEEGENLYSFSALEDAVSFLAQTQGPILSTLGSKELPALTALPDWRQRIFARVLPLPAAVLQAQELGLPAGQLICMQGPFSKEMNLAMLRQYRCQWLLTKDSGRTGGFEEKRLAAQEAGVGLVLVGRPKETQQGFSYEKVLAAVLDRCGAFQKLKEEILQQENKNTQIELGQNGAAHFPFFLDIRDKWALVAGGGSIATRRVKTLCRFAMGIRVVSPQVTPELEQLAKEGRIQWKAKKLERQDLEGAAFAVAATSSREANRQAGLWAKELGLPVSVADCREECSFFFPAVAEKGSLILGLTGDGSCHKEVSQCIRTIREVLSFQ